MVTVSKTTTPLLGCTDYREENKPALRGPNGFAEFISPLNMREVWK
jgi:hypothetical protein